MLKPESVAAAVAAVAATFALVTGAAAAPQMPDMDVLEKWSSVKIVHYEVTGEINDKHVQLPPTDADLYGDVTDKVTLSFDWDKNKMALVGPVTFKNLPATVTNLVAIQKGCPVGSLNGPYEHFDIVEVKASTQSPGALELIGRRVHPDTMVTQACGSKPTLFKGAIKPRTEFIAPVDPMILAVGNGPAKTIRVTPDKKSIVMTALNNHWTWTFTPTPK